MNTTYNQPYPNPNDIAASAVYPTRTLEISYEGKLSRTINVLEPTSTTPLYTIKTKALKPHLTFTSSTSPSTDPIATVSFHNLSRKIDITIRGQATTLKPEWKLKSTYSYTSPNTSSARTWQANKLVSTDMVCLDENGIALARWTFPKWSMTKLGTLEIVGDGVGEEAMLEELVVVGVTVAYHIVQQTGAAAASAGGAAGGAAAAAG